jgi:hypothetical protein
MRRPHFYAVDCIVMHRCVEDPTHREVVHAHRPDGLPQVVTHDRHLR